MILISDTKMCMSLLQDVPPLLQLFNVFHKYDADIHHYIEEILFSGSLSNSSILYGCNWKHIVKSYSQWA